MDKHELVSKLIDQHKGLQKALLLTKEYSLRPDSGDRIISELDEFKKILGEHLELENEVFYPDYIAKITKAGQEVESTKEFIGQMDGIGLAVKAFLGEYETAEKINGNLSGFSEAVGAIASTLNVRITTEEEGVFQIYLSL